MKKITFYSLIAYILINVSATDLKAQEQSNKKLYSSTSLEIIFSFAEVGADSISISNVMRFAPVVNFQWLLNYDMSKNFGVYSGLDIRNLGFIRENLAVDPNLKFKHRVYTFGLPLGLKVGDLDNGVFVYFGGQVEWAWNYKEKRFEDKEKVDKFVEWNSKRVNQIQTSAFVGINFPYGMNIKFKYYFTDLLNEDFVQYDANGTANYPYAGQRSQIFYFSINFFMFHPTRNYYKKVQRD